MVDFEQIDDSQFIDCIGIGCDDINKVTMEYMSTAMKNTPKEFMPRFAEYYLAFKDFIADCDWYINDKELTTLFINTVFKKNHFTDEIEPNTKRLNIFFAKFWDFLYDDTKHSDYSIDCRLFKRFVENLYSLKLSDKDYKYSIEGKRDLIQIDKPVSYDEAKNEIVSILTKYYKSCLRDSFDHNALNHTWVGERTLQITDRDTLNSIIKKDVSDEADKLLTMFKHRSDTFLDHIETVVFNNLLQS